MKKKFFIFTLIIGLTFTLVGINKAFAISTLGSSKSYHFGFLKGNPYDETGKLEKYTTSAVYQKVKDINISYTSWVKANGHDVSHGHNYTVRKKGVVLMTNYALEDNKGSGTVIASIAAKKDGNGHSNGYWSADY
ncbi:MULTISPECIES: hypothetical protein [Bacillus]|uniref:DUF2712 domain-containing protein n=2 Tax=Bacillus velezensis TaxID=492670 RepID=A0A411ABY2_BACVE|nr:MULTISPECIES: hypothetical protein [Bacillus]ASB55248.1 hypothetical protein S100072_03943 [Bacillus velezensis]AVB09604.1 hypothetical protein C3438_08655 [Bacillus velezensis]AXS62767.1 hypothetical protein CK238_19745 [Bacillus velezensis]MCG1015744.1 hypothetical protein [Bacillus velezensis]MCM8509260.1 hypothetical protein [Bacillus amyloliquefaciens]